jgi:hypothetical protein
MICPRCESKTVKLLAESPVKGAWETYICGTCFFSWRSTEDEGLTDPAKYDSRFKIDSAKIPSMMQIPPLPKRRVKQRGEK